MSDLTQLYQDIILGHNKRPRNYGTLEDFSGKAEKNNPLCGDEVTVYWKTVDNRISDLRFTAQGCAISRASASIMTELLSGKSQKESVAIFDAFRALLEEESGASTEVVARVQRHLMGLGMRRALIPSDDLVVLQGN